MIFPSYQKIQYPVYEPCSYSVNGTNVTIDGASDCGLTGGTTCIQTYTYPLETYSYEFSVDSIDSLRNDFTTREYARQYEEQMRILGDRYAADLNGIIQQRTVPNAQGILDGLQRDIDRGWWMQKDPGTVMPAPPPPPIQLSPAEIVALNERNMQEQQAAASRAEAAAQKRVIAVNNGEKLLEDVLGSSEYAKLRKDGFIDIPSVKTSDMMYRVRKNHRIGVVKLENGIWVEKALSLCIHPESHWKYVDGDQVAAHVLLCKYDESTLEKVANKYHTRAA